MINSRFERVSAAQLYAAKHVAASILSDVSGRRGALDGRIRAVAAGMRTVGPALTVEVRPGDNLMIHAALVLAQPGDVLVIDGKGWMGSALMGELMCAHAKAAGIAGVVIDGAVRDVDTLSQGDFAVFASGASPNGPTRNQAGRIGYPVSIGGVCVAPGDLIVGDDDGVVAIAQASVDQVLAAAKLKIESEQQRMKDIAEGRLVYGWLEGALMEAGVLAQDRSLQDLMAEFSPPGDQGGR